jgi:single-strand DNA-binding protein
VSLTGTLSRPAQRRTLAGGATVTAFVLAVRTEASAATDAIDCVTHARGLGDRVLGRKPGDLLSVEGRLRRRFWTGANGLVSRYEVDVHRLAFVRAGPRP